MVCLTTTNISPCLIFVRSQDHKNNSTKSVFSTHSGQKPPPPSTHGRQNTRPQCMAAVGCMLSGGCAHWLQRTSCGLLAASSASWSSSRRSRSSAMSRRSAARSANCCAVWYDFSARFCSYIVCACFARAACSCWTVALSASAAAAASARSASRAAAAAAAASNWRCSWALICVKAS